jgi:tRNA threonylcarbamoyladenosine biosynthesis protein TsaE
MSSNRTTTYHSFSSEGTKKFGEGLATKLLGHQSAFDPRGALVFALRGDLGAGKTTFVQGFLKGLGLKKRAPSPTFVIMRRHVLKHKKFSNIFHVDAYRLKNAEQLDALDFKAVLADPRNIVLVEWADRVRSALPARAIWLRFEHGKKENERAILFGKPAIMKK